MRVSLVGHFADSLDEGVRKVGKHMAKELESRGIEVKKTNITSITHWKEIRNFRPDIIHFVLSPALSGLIITKFISILHFKAKTIISAIQPAIPNWKVLKLFNPNLVLVQSEESERLFRSIGYQTEFLPNGVDVNKFKPVDLRTKERLRDKYRVSHDKFLILHLASLKKERNLDIFKRIQKQEGNQVIVIGRENESIDKEVVSELQKSGCIVWIKHFPNIEEIYNLSDCYVFPVINKKACIEMPLSVLEAMACNLPVITTKFGALQRIFDDGDGLFFVEKEEDFYKGLKEVKNGAMEIKTREKILPYSWENIVKKLDEIYEELLYE